MFKYISSSLSRKFSFAIFGVVLFASAVFGWFSYSSTRSALSAEINSKLESVQREKARAVRDFIEINLARTAMLAKEPEVTGALPPLFALHAADGGTASGGYSVASGEYRELTRRLDPMFKNRMTTKGFDNLLLVCAEHGHVLYSTARESDLGTNLRTGPYKGSALARLWKEVVKTGKPFITDYTVYAPSKNPAMFIGAPVFDGNKRVTAVVVEQFSSSALTEVIGQEEGFGATSEVFLVGEDRLLRSDLRLMPGELVLKKKIETQAVRDVFEGRSDTAVYPDYRGKPVLVSYALLGLNKRFGTDFDWAIIAKQDAAEAFAPLSSYTKLFLLILISTLGLALVAGVFVARATTMGVTEVAGAADAVARGNFEVPITVSGEDEVGRLAESVRRMQASLRETTEKNRRAADEIRAKSELLEKQDWLKTGLARLDDIMRGDLDVKTLSQRALAEIAARLDAKVGALYLADGGKDGPGLALAAGYAFDKPEGLAVRFKFGQGLVGQAAAAKEQILVSEVPEDYIKISSGLGDARPRFIALTPFLFEGKVKGVLETGTLTNFTPAQLDYLRQAMAALAVNLDAAQSREALALALAKSQALGEELQTQQEALKSLNEELEEQTQALEHSEQSLKSQQEELRASNEELEEANQTLGEQKREVEGARQDLVVKADALDVASKYKSAFLANMSHELRTPLNSLLLLAADLEENKEGNLNAEQLQAAQIIHGTGNDLLSLITDILDLSKIEAGQLALRIADVAVRDLAEGVKTRFGKMFAGKELDFAVKAGDDCPAVLKSDRKRLDQILTNLISNALKFTEKGGVTVEFLRSGQAGFIDISVKDTGIGIPKDKQELVFEAFQQLETGLSKRYGGTGLGLSIARELAALLGGTIELESAPEKGSTFTLRVPVESEPSAEAPPARTPQPQQAAPKTMPARSRPIPSIADDRDTLKDTDYSILIIEDDLAFAKVLADKCRKKKLKCLAAASGEDGLALAARFRPSGIILDLRLPGMDGWKVLETLKDDPKLRHIPVHIISVEEGRLDALSRGAVGYVMKPATREQLDEAFAKLSDVSGRKIKDLLVVEDDPVLRKSIVKLIGNGDVHTDEAADGAGALKALKSKHYDCVILDLGLPDMTGFELLKTLEADEEAFLPPIIVHTGQDLTREEEAELRRHAESIIIKGVRSEARLLDEASLFLHRVVEKLPETKRKMITDLHDADALFRGKRVLVVDDDMRNVFALSKILKGKGFEVLKAEHGRRALEVLEADGRVDLVLMDIMMPEMDGYEAMRRIRAQKKFEALPIIALTAKAMQQDRKLCIEAGASDYLPKPVDLDRLLSMMRVWLYR